MSVYLPKGKNKSAKTAYYHYDFVLKPAGRSASERFCGSTGQKTKAAAVIVENKLRLLAALGKLGHLMTLGQGTQRYLKEKAPRVPDKIPGEVEPQAMKAKRQARRQQELCMTELLTYFGEDTPLMGITPDLVSTAVEQRASTETIRWKLVDGELLPMPTGRLPKPATVNRQIVGPLRRVLRRARKHWGIPIDLEQFHWGGEDGVMLEEPEERNRELTVAEELRFWRSLDADYHLICEMYIISGKRQSIWIMLEKFRINQPDKKVQMRKLKKKREEWHWFDLTEREAEIIEAAMAEAPECPFLFTAISQSDRDRGRRIPITTRMLYDAVKRACEAASIEDFRPHDFRHTFGSRAAREDANPKKLMRAMDHGSLRSTMRYINVLQSEVTELRSSVRVNKALPPNVRPLKLSGSK